MRGAVVGSIILLATTSFAQPQVRQWTGTVMQPAITLPQPVLAGSTILLVANWDDASGTLDVTLTDDQGLQWLEVTPAVHGVDGGSAMNAHVFRAVSGGGPLTITPSLGTYNLVAFEYAGLEAFPRSSAVSAVGGPPRASLQLDAGTDAFAFAFLITYGVPGATPAGWTELNRWDGDFYAQLDVASGAVALDLDCTDLWAAQVMVFSRAQDAGVDAGGDGGAEGLDAGQVAPPRRSFIVGCATSPATALAGVLLGFLRRRRV